MRERSLRGRTFFQVLPGTNAIRTPKRLSTHGTELFSDFTSEGVRHKPERRFMYLRQSC
jgi:hypothetical protein